MKIVNFLDRASRFLIDPSNKNFSPLKKGLAWAITILTAIPTIGMVQIASALWRKARHVTENNDTQDAISKIFQNIFKKKPLSSESEHPSQNKTQATSSKGRNLTPQEKKIIKEFTPEMVEALGGVHSVLSIPLIENWDGSFNPANLTAPVMRGYYGKDQPFLLFCYFRKTDAGLQILVDHLGREIGKKKGWRSGNDNGELNLRWPNLILDKSGEAKFMLDKISRLMNGKAIGGVQRYPGVVLFKDETFVPPTDAYLKGDELNQFVKLDTIFYEKKPEEGTTDIFLFNPNSERESLNELFRKFPNMKPQED